MNIYWLFSISMDNFPARLPGKLPPTSGGFYKYPKSMRSLPELKTLKPKFRPSTQIILEPPMGPPKRSPIFRDLSPRSTSPDFERSDLGSFSLSSATAFDTVNISCRPPLVTSFKEIMDHKPAAEFINLLPGKRHASTQTESSDLDSLDLSDITNYKSWLKFNVDPILKVIFYKN